MRIVMDLDEVLAGLNPVLNRFYNQRHGTNYTMKDHTSHMLPDVWGVTMDEAKSRVNELYASKDFDDVSPITGSQEAIRKLSRRNHLYVVTARPVHVWEKTVVWLEKYFPDAFMDVRFSGEVFGGEKKHVICKKLKADLVVEDSGENIAKCAEDKMRGILFDYPWNQGYAGDGVVRVGDWQAPGSHWEEASRILGYIRA